MDESAWVELPGLYDEALLEELCHEMDAARVDHESASIPLKDGQASGPRAGRVRVRSGHVPSAAKVLGVFFDVEDPAEAQPFRGQCPACEEDVPGVWTCPSCEISFRSSVNPNDPLVLFLREHGGFVASDAVIEDDGSTAGS